MEYVLKEGAKVEQKEVKLWVNGLDGRGYQDERSATYAAAKGRICECGKEYEGTAYTICPECREIRKKVNYYSLSFEEWDGKTPLTECDGEDFFFSLDEIEDYCDEFDVDVKDLRLVICVPVEPTPFNLDDYLEDDLPEDYAVKDVVPKGCMSAEELEKIVNDWFKAVSPISWVAGNKRTTVSLRSV